ncbi:hypothetical protein [Thiocapsa bogorovii]|uniref:hypothetical protein n=1 Tax=Thiocapsa bogorovii TaxID=521689 RepID=UPI001E494246|nr:hypothetical protein [Thiocapsa bogorovii]UHD16581.1 hypothetical protein LT988_00500 [Thiocapsa bogorovii]
MDRYKKNLRIAAVSTILFVLGLPLPSTAQEPTPDGLPGVSRPESSPIETPFETRDTASLQSLEALNKALSSQEEQVEETQRRLIAAEDDVTRQALGDDLRELRKQLKEQRLQFERFALEIDLRPFIDEVDESFDWQEELSKLLKPILAELESATAESRAIGELRAEINQVEERKVLAEEAVAHLERLLAEGPSEDLRARLEERLAHWKRVADDTANRYTALDLQLENRLEQRQSVLDETTAYAKRFFQTRGLNLLLAVGAFSAVFFGVRFLSSLVDRLQASKGAAGPARTRFSSRLTALLLHVFSVLGGLIAMMLVFNMAGDWFMLGIIVIFLIGVAWASIKTLPSQLETVRLVLNIGAVREGERIRFNGLPYQVEVLGFRVRLVNPHLDGGLQEIPVNALVGLYSRPAGADEQWFPTRTGDWVELADGRMGQVSRQSPSAVHLSEIGGEDVVYPTDVFVGLNPRRLSEGFRIVSTFGIDYRHQAIATTEVPERMRDRLEQELPDVVPREHIKAVAVYFQSAAASSLDYEIHVDLAGEVAPRMPLVRHAIQRILVDACNDNGWEIPFTQITLHQAPG